MLADDQMPDEVAALAAQPGLPVVRGDAAAAFDGVLQWTGDALVLQWTGPTTAVPGEARRSTPLRADLLALDIASGPGQSLRQPLAKAVGIRKGQPRPHVLDATGGLGEDAWLLAAWGCTVVICERHPVVAALLADALRRAAAVKPVIARRIELITTDARQHLARLNTREGEQGRGMRDERRGVNQTRQPTADSRPPDSLPPDTRHPTPDTRYPTPHTPPPPDVIYLDPMFPADSDRSALERKPMRILRRLVGDDGDARTLFDLARPLAARRVVVKRPAHAPPLAPSPLTAHHAKAHRFDVYPPQ